MAEYSLRGYTVAMMILGVFTMLLSGSSRAEWKPPEVGCEHFVNGCSNQNPDPDTPPSSGSSAFERVRTLLDAEEVSLMKALGLTPAHGASAMLQVVNTQLENSFVAYESLARQLNSIYRGSDEIVEDVEGEAAYLQMQLEAFRSVDLDAAESALVAWDRNLRTLASRVSKANRAARADYLKLARGFSFNEGKTAHELLPRLELEPTILDHGERVGPAKPRVSGLWARKVFRFPRGALYGVDPEPEDVARELRRLSAARNMEREMRTELQRERAAARRLQAAVSKRRDAQFALADALVSRKERINGIRFFMREAEDRYNEMQRKAWETIRLRAAEAMLRAMSSRIPGSEAFVRAQSWLLKKSRSLPGFLRESLEEQGCAVSDIERVERLAQTQLRDTEELMRDAYLLGPHAESMARLKPYAEEHVAAIGEAGQKLVRLLSAMEHDAKTGR